MYKPILEEEVFEDLTDRQRGILQFVGEYAEESGYPPTIREIGRRFGISSTKGVKLHLDALEKKGYLRRAGRGARAISVRTHPPPPIRLLPVVGRVAAGVPVLAEENIEGWVALDSSLAKKEGSFLLRVMGDSMIEEGILDGDFVLVRPQKVAENGEVVVAMVEGEATVKRFHLREDRVELLPAKQGMRPIVVPVDSGEVRILGKVVGVLRTKV